MVGISVLSLVHISVSLLFKISVSSPFPISVYNQYMEFHFFIKCQSYSVDRTDLFKIAYLVLGVEMTVSDVWQLFISFH
jgi:hypothetical protein